VSGEAAIHPVVNRKTGSVFERALVLKALQEAGTTGGGLRDPVSGEEVGEEDLIDLVDSRCGV
jgi:Holliday junction resolvase